MSACAHAVAAPAGLCAACCSNAVTAMVVHAPLLWSTGTLAVCEHVHHACRTCMHTLVLS